MTPAINNPVIQLIIALCIVGVFLVAVRIAWTWEMVKRHRDGLDTDEDDNDEMEFRL